MEGRECPFVSQLTAYYVDDMVFLYRDQPGECIERSAPLLKRLKGIMLKPEFTEHDRLLAQLVGLRPTPRREPNPTIYWPKRRSKRIGIVTMRCRRARTKGGTYFFLHCITKMTDK